MISNILKLDSTFSRNVIVVDMEAIIIFFTTFISTVLSTMSGGGASIINLPIFPVANSIQKISATFWVVPAAKNYLEGRKIDWVFLIIFSVIGLIGVYFGVLVTINVNQRYLEVGIGIIIIFLVCYTYFHNRLGLKEEEKKYGVIRKNIAYPFALILGFYESIFGAGNAIFLASITFLTHGFDFIDALGYYFAIIFLWLVFASLLFIQKGYFNLYLTIPAIIGSTAGGYIGSKYARYKGNKFIRLMFIIIGGILGIKLILGI